MDVSPKQLVSVAAALIPFLENDDANRALMGSNMQRQAVPLVRPTRRSSAPAWKQVVARDSGAAITARRTGVVDQVGRQAYRHPRHGGDRSVEAGRRHLHALLKFQRSNQNTCINQRPLVRVGDQVKAGDIIADGPSTELGDLALGRTCSSRSCRGTATTSKTRSCSPSAS
jgi:DNA-directed RNA polymerase subunit beta